MHAQRTIPPDGTYRFVLYRTDWNPDIEYDQGACGEVKKTRCIDWPEDKPLPPAVRGSTNRYLPTEKDRRTCMVFVLSPHLRARLVKLGWTDCTGLWFKPKEVVKPEPPPPPKVDSKPLGQTISVPIPPTQSRRVSKKSAA